MIDTVILGSRIRTHASLASLPVPQVRALPLTPLTTPWRHLHHLQHRGNTYTSLTIKWCKGIITPTQPKTFTLFIGSIHQIFDACMWHRFPDAGSNQRIVTGVRVRYIFLYIHIKYPDLLFSLSFEIAILVE